MMRVFLWLAVLAALPGLLLGWLIHPHGDDGCESQS